MNNSNNSIKIMIAGASGMVGNAIKKRYLNAEKYNPQIYKILSPSRNELNLLNFEEVKNWFEENCPDIVILAAAKVGGIFANKNNPADFILHNLKIQTNLIEISNYFKVKKFLFLGSSCIYPRLATQPITEKDLLSGQLEITNEPYAIAKIAGVKMCEAYNKQYKTKYLSLMPTNTYGPNDNYDINNSHFFPALIKKAHECKIKKQKIFKVWGSGKPLRELIFVDDIADACLFFMKKKTKNVLINIGTGKEKSISDYAKFIVKKINIKVKIKFDKSKPDGVPRKVLDISLAKKYGWKPKVSLDEGFNITYKDFLKNKNRT